MKQVGAENFIDRLRAARSSFAAVRMGFDQLIARADGSPIVVVENREDVSYYYHYIADYLRPRSSIHFHLCHGKPNLLRLHEHYISTYKRKYRTVFLADKDHDDLLGRMPVTSKYLYSTTFYSIENEVVNLRSLENVLRGPMAIDDNDQSIDGLTAKFELGLQNFVKWLRPVMAYALARRRNDLAVNYNNINLDQIFEWDANLLLKSKRGWWKRFRSRIVQLGPEPQRSDIRKAYKDIGTLHYNVVIRGKYMLWTLLSFLKRVRDNLSDERRSGEPRLAIDPPLTPEHCIAQMAAITERPTAFLSFLDKWKRRWRRGVKLYGMRSPAYGRPAEC